MRVFWRDSLQHDTVRLSSIKGSIVVSQRGAVNVAASDNEGFVMCEKCKWQVPSTSFAV